MTTVIPLRVVAGYPRICAGDHLDENTDIRCRIVAGFP
jgi:hypothetical protein